MKRRLTALTVAVVVVLPLSAIAAKWQWSRHIERDGRNAQIAAAQIAPVARFPGPLSDGYQDSDRFRRITASGRFLPDEQLLVRKSVVNGSVGFNVMTPFLTDDGTRLYVIRGWTADASATSPAAPSSPTQVVLRINAVLPNGAFRPSDLPTGEINWVDPETLAAGRPHASAVFELISPLDPSLIALPAPQTSAGPHVSYTIQWILIGCTAIIVYIRVLRREIQESRENWVL